MNEFGKLFWLGIGIILLGFFLLPRPASAWDRNYQLPMTWMILYAQHTGLTQQEEHIQIKIIKCTKELPKKEISFMEYLRSIEQCKEK